MDRSSRCIHGNRKHEEDMFPVGLANLTDQDVMAPSYFIFPFANISGHGFH
jgi:hypothetical protein